ncbi:hypothetical protein P8452_73834 [Trifolium repens]|nr:hypothetical protein P8452_73834 [Trifolium repens]
MCISGYDMLAKEGTATSGFNPSNSFDSSPITTIKQSNIQINIRLAHLSLTLTQNSPQILNLIAKFLNRKVSSQNFSIANSQFEFFVPATRVFICFKRDMTDNTGRKRLGILIILSGIWPRFWMPQCGQKGGFLL